MGQSVECNLTGYSCNRQRDKQRERKKDSQTNTWTGRDTFLNTKMTIIMGQPVECNLTGYRSCNN